MLRLLIPLALISMAIIMPLQILWLRWLGQLP
jgi:hypothetical protein